MAGAGCRWEVDVGKTACSPLDSSCFDWALESCLSQISQILQSEEDGPYPDNTQSQPEVIEKLLCVSA